MLIPLLFFLKLQAEELVDGPSVKSAEVEQTLDKLKAEQQDLDPMMTTQGQLENLYKDFENFTIKSFKKSINEL